jgi:hypothetical protein
MIDPRMNTNEAQMITNKAFGNSLSHSYKFSNKNRVILV